MKTIHNILNLRDNRGFTLLEIIIVLIIISLTSLIVLPRISTLLDSKRTNFLILTTVIAKTFDDSFIKERQNFLVIHLYEPMSGSKENIEEIFSRNNGISVVTRNDDGKFQDSPNKILQYKEFPDSFKIEEVILSTGARIASGNVMVPFYPQGQSDNVILHILINDEKRWSVRIFKLKKEPEIHPEYLTFEDLSK